MKRKNCILGELAIPYFANKVHSRMDGLIPLEIWGNFRPEKRLPMFLNFPESDGIPYSWQGLQKRVLHS
jgi:hypothetical protein